MIHPEPRNDSHSSLEPRYKFKVTLSLEVIPIALLLYCSLSLAMKLTISPEPYIDLCTALLDVLRIVSGAPAARRNSQVKPHNHIGKRNP